MDAADDFERAAAWVRRHDFPRVAVQMPDSLMGGAVRTVAKLQASLPGRKIFLLGDSTYGSSSVDEVGAEHYGADCIIHIGSSDQEHAGLLPVLFIFGRTSGTAQTAAERAAVALVSALSEAPAPPDDDAPAVALVCDSGLQHASAELAAALGSAFAAAASARASAAAPRRGAASVLVAEPQLESSGAAANGAGADGARCGGVGVWRDFRFGTLPIAAAWWACLGPLPLAAAGRPDPLRVCGRRVRRVVAGEGVGDHEATPLRQLPHGCALLYVGAEGSSLERRLLLRHGNAHPVFRLDHISGDLTKLSSDALLMKRYRYVELARAAGTIGLLMCATGSTYGKSVADRLEALLRRADRRVYRFVIGRVTPEKLGNFNQVDCFVSLASPDHFPFDGRDFHVPIASPYEVEVAFGAREWSGGYVIDLEELLLDPLPNGAPSEESLHVQTLGASARICSFGGITTAAGSGGSIMDPAVAAGAAAIAQAGWAPARASPGLHGVAGRYASEVGHAVGGGGAA